MKAWVIKHPTSKKLYWDEIGKVWAGLCYAMICKTKEEANNMLAYTTCPEGKLVKVTIKEV